MISPASASAIRSTSVSSSARFVITAETCGMPRGPRNVAPPLKSTSTKFSASGGWVAASADHERAQELALAGAGGADAEPVRPAAALCGLLEVQHDRRAALVDADRHAQPVDRGGLPSGAQARRSRAAPAAGPTGRADPGAARAAASAEIPAGR